MLIDKYAGKKMGTSMNEKWPNFFIAGAARAGTTSLYEYLKTNPYVYLPEIKEPRYFLARSELEDIYGRTAIGNKQSYLDLFAKSEAVAVGEATPEYLYSESAARLIRDVIPTAKIIITLRNPITRAFSHYLLLKWLWNVKYTFEELVHIEYNQLKAGSKSRPFRSPGVLECGLYAEGVQRYSDLFGSQNVMIMIFEEWTRDPLNAINSILDFLQVDYRFDKLPEVVRDNASRMHDDKLAAWAVAMVNDNSTALSRIYQRFPPFAKALLKDFYHKRLSTGGTLSKESISFETRKFLHDFYQNDVQNLRQNLRIQPRWDDFET